MRGAEKIKWFVTSRLKGIPTIFFDIAIFINKMLCVYQPAQMSASKLLRTTRSFEHQTKVLHSFSKVHMKNPGADPVRYSPTFFSLHALRLRSRCKKKAVSMV